MSKWNNNISMLIAFDFVRAICCYQKEQHTILSSYLRVESAVFKEAESVFFLNIQKAEILCCHYKSFNND